MEDFSLFEGDGLNRFLGLFRIKSRGLAHHFARFLLIFIVTFIPTALFCLLDGYGPGNIRTMNFFGDVGAFSQLFLGYPLFIIAEIVISKKTRGTAHHFLNSGIVPEQYIGEVHSIHQRLATLRKKILPDIICLAIAYLCAAFWLWEETHNAYDTWHAIGAPAVQSPTRAGWWVALVGIPVFNYWWLRWIWKVSLWCWYLKKISALRLRLIASHPDLTGGLAFVSETQGSFAILIFAYGIGIIAPLLAYKLDIEQASFFSFSVGGPFFGFVIGAPLFFCLPLLFFTKQLSRVKKRAVDAYQERATEAALNFEETWLTQCQKGNCDMLLSGHVSAMNHLNTAYEHIKKMRVVPFDLKSFSQLTGSTLGSLIPILPKLFDLPEPFTHFIEFIKPFVGK